MTDQEQIVALRQQVETLTQERQKCDKCGRLLPREFIAIEVEDGGPTDDPAGFMWCVVCHSQGVVSNLRAQLAALSVALTWQQTETAPKDGTNVLLCWDDGIAAPRFDVGYNLGFGRRRQNTHDWLHNAQSWPTLWMALPPHAASSPTTKEEQDDALTRRVNSDAQERRSAASTD